MDQIYRKDEIMGKIAKYFKQIQEKYKEDKE